MTNDSRKSAAGRASAFTPLTGVRVVDLSKVLAGPLCTQSLGDLGADVIKVEPVEVGDDTRAWPPKVAGEGAVFLSVNRNKRSLSVDLKTAAGKQIVMQLIADADVVVESFRKGVAERLGLGYAALKALNPRLIYVSISGFGRTGPLSELPGYDVMVQAFSGIMAITGEKGGGPARAAFSPIDQTTGIWAAFGIMAALRHRDATGEGQQLEVSLFETAMSFMGYTAQIYWTNGRAPERNGSGHESICPYQAFRAADEYILIAVGNEKLWQRFCAVAGLEAMADEPRFRTNMDRVAHFEETVSRISEKIRERPVAEWALCLTAAGVPNSPINAINDVLAMPHTRERGVVLDYQDERRGPLHGMAMPVVFGGAPRSVNRAPPVLGEHTVELLTGLGYTSDAIKALVDQGVIRVDPQ